MDKIFNAVSVIVGIVGGVCAALFGAWDVILKILLVIMALDYVTGVIKAVYTKTVSSETGFSGLMKKVTVLAIIVLSNMVQILIADKAPVRETVIMFYIANEGISILENVAAVSTKMPPAVKNILLQLRGDGE